MYSREGTYKVTVVPAYIFFDSDFNLIILAIRITFETKSMMALQSATKVPDPQSIPENAPEHCPVSSKVPRLGQISYLDYLLGNGFGVRRQIRRMCRLR